MSSSYSPHEVGELLFSVVYVEILGNEEAEQYSLQLEWTSLVLYEIANCAKREFV